MHQPRTRSGFQNKTLNEIINGHFINAIRGRCTHGLSVAFGDKARRWRLLADTLKFETPTAIFSRDSNCALASSAVVGSAAKNSAQNDGKLNAYDGEDHSTTSQQTAKI
jgi:hypothetical protein